MTGGSFESGLTETGSGSEGTGVRLVAVIAELALPRLLGIVGVSKFLLMCELAHASHWDRPLVCVGDKPIGGNVGYTVPQWSASGDIKHPLRRCFSTTLVMAILNRMIGGIETMFGIERSTANRAPPTADPPATSDVRADPPAAAASKGGDVGRLPVTVERSGTTAGSA
jgi:hypothetical protein